MKNDKFGFVILSPEHHIGRVESTIRSIKTFHSSNPILCVTGKEAPDEDVKEIGKKCRVVKGEGTITSLINKGMLDGYVGWNIFIMEGAVVKPTLSTKIFMFADSDKDILFPIDMDHNREGKPIRLYMEFYDSTLNGLTIHQDTFKKVGNMDDGPLEETRMVWMNEAMIQGCKFKAVLGAKSY